MKQIKVILITNIIAKFLTVYKPMLRIELIAAISINGKITDKTGSFSKYSSKEDQEFLHKKIKASDVLVMGRKTFEKHVEKAKKPMIVFSRQVRHLETDKKDGQQITWFNDSRQEFLNIIDLLQYKKVTILGGAEIYHWFIKQNLLTDIFLTVEPYIIDSGKNLLEGTLLEMNSKWKLKSAKKINKKGTLLLHYQS